MIKKIRNDVYNNLKSYPMRLFHVINVMLVATNLSIKHNVNLKDTYIAALTHDYAKYAKIDFYKRYIKTSNIDKYKNAQTAYHGFAAANYFKRHYKINDDTYNAIYYHVFGRPKMSKLEQIIFIADAVYLNDKDNTQLLYKVALENLDKAMLIACKLSYKDLSKKELTPHIDQIKTYNYYKRRLLSEKS